MTSPYELIGGEPNLRRLVHRFYELMDTLPEAYQLRKLHPEDLGSSEDKLFMYLSGWLGGPQLFVEKFGHPRLRARHLPFPIDVEVRNQWLMCMQLAAEEVVPDNHFVTQFMEALTQLANHMRNQAESHPSS